MPAPNVLIKSASESRLYDIDFSYLLVDGETMSAPVVSATPTGLTLGTPVVSGDLVQVRISSGTENTNYCIDVSVTTSNGNTLSDCVKLFIGDCAWLAESTRILRNLIDDTCSVPTYTNIRLGEIFLVAAQQVLAELTFDNTYTINVKNLYLSPDPTATATRDEAFLALVSLKAACIVDLGDLRTRARLEGIKIKDSMGEISTGKTTEGFRSLIELGACSLYKEAKKQYGFGNTDICRAIMTPYSSANLGWTLGWYDPRTRDYFS